MEVYRHFEYMEWVARHLKGVGHSDGDRHYLRSDDVEDIRDLEGLLTGIRGVVLVAVDGGDSDVRVERDSMVDKSQYFVSIMGQCEVGNMDAVYEAKLRCRVLMDELMAKMVSDCALGEHGLYALNVDEFTVRGIGPLADNFYGVVLGFTVNRVCDYVVDDSMWL